MADKNHDSCFHNEGVKLLFSTLQFSCMWWMPAQAVNFTFCPNQYRVVFIGVASLIWVNILCILKRGKAPEVVANEEKLDKLS